MSKSSEVYLDRGPGLPESYGEDAIVALPRDPECLVFYWDVAAENAGADLVVRVHCLDRGSFYDVDLPDSRRPWHLAVESNHAYRIDLLRRETDGSLRTLAESAEVSLPVRHVWQLADRPAELEHAEQHPIASTRHIAGARARGPVAESPPDWPTGIPVPRPADVHAPPPIEPGAYVNFAQEP